MYAPILLFAALALGQPAQAPPLHVPPPPQAPPLACESALDAVVYPRASTEAIRRGYPLVVFVGTKVRGLPGVVCCQLDCFENDSAPRVIAAVPDGAGLSRYAVNGLYHLPATATDADIQSAIASMRRSATKAVQPSADPFDSSNSSERLAPADGSRATAGPQYNGSHRCPTCGASVTIISGRGPGSTHTHTCPRDGTTWYH